MVAARQPAHHSFHKLLPAIRHKTNGQEGITVIPVTKMTEPGKALTPAPARLDGKSLAPSQSEGNTIDLRTCPKTRCPEYDVHGSADHDCTFHEGQWAAHHKPWMFVCPNYHQWWECDHNATIERYRSAQERLGNAHPATMRALIAAVQSQKEHDDYATTWEKMRLKKQNRENAKAKLGPHEFTLTYSPRQHGWSRDEAKEQMRTAIERLTRYYREEIEEFHATGEYNASGDPHVHAWYRMEGGRKITTKSFQRAYPIWNPKRRTGPRGHEGGHHEPVKRQADFAGYIEKDLHTAWLKVDITNALPQDTTGPQAEDDAQPSDDASPHPTDGAGERT